MRNHVAAETVELEDELELHDEEFRMQIADGYQAYLRGATRDLNELIAELQNELTLKHSKGNEV